MKTNQVFASLTLAALFFASAVLPASAVTIGQWTFESSVQTPVSVDPNATATDFTLSSGTVSFVTGNAPTATTAISGIGWNVTDGVKWWGFTVTADAGYELNLTSLTFDDRASGTGPTLWSVTVNGITAASSQSSHGSFSSNPMNTVDLSALDFQALGSAEIKIFGFGASASGGTWRLDNVILSGTLDEIPSVPEAGSSLALLGLALGSLGLVARFRWIAERCTTK